MFWFIKCQKKKNNYYSNIHMPNEEYIHSTVFFTKKNLFKTTTTKISTKQSDAVKIIIK